ncbi:small integral membrane protein 26 [Phodopus roborovskii]|uniref:Smim26 protein n=1 Tax=Phodopus roborovskii TaxID=109678 RepID=A0AAU9Z7C9_PHORO|nr:small integral membrane protein 26 [Phodopus roborovskii]CAH6787775.1 Smim26 [Phodopus roborovskii]
MRPEQASLWYRRLSVVYAVGAWSVLGTAVFFTRNRTSGDGEQQKDGSRSKTHALTSEVSDLEREINEPIEGSYVQTFVHYSEKSVPVIQRILDYLKSWTGGPGPES